MRFKDRVTCATIRIEAMPIGIPMAIFPNNKPTVIPKIIPAGIHNIHKDLGFNIISIIKILFKEIFSV
jgi:hypothetical protein